MSSASKVMPIVRQLALTATRPSALHTLTSVEATSARIFRALTASTPQRRHASQITTTSNTSSLPQGPHPKVLRCINELQLESIKQWQHLHRHDEALGHSTNNTARSTHYDVGFEADQDAIDNSEILRQLDYLRSAVMTLQQAKTGNTTPQAEVGLTSAEPTETAVDSEVLREFYHLEAIKAAQENLLLARADQISAQAYQISAKDNLISQLNTTNAVLRRESEVLRGPHVNIERRAPDNSKTKQQDETHKQSKEDGEASHRGRYSFTGCLFGQVAGAVIGISIGRYLWGDYYARDWQQTQPAVHGPSFPWEH